MSQRVIWIFIRKPRKRIWTGHFYRVQFSHSVVSDSLRPHELQHARPPCPSPTPGVHSNSCPSSRWWEGKQWISVCSRRVRVDRQVSSTYKHTCQICVQRKSESRQKLAAHTSTRVSVCCAHCILVFLSWTLASS